MQNLDLQEIRKKLDAIDKDLVALFEERMKLCADVASFKIENQSTMGNEKSRNWKRCGSWLTERLTNRLLRSCFPRL